MKMPYELPERAWRAGSLNDACAISAAEELRRVAGELDPSSAFLLVARADELDPDGAR